MTSWERTCWSGRPIRPSTSPFLNTYSHASDAAYLFQVTPTTPSKLCRPFVKVLNRYNSYPFVRFPVSTLLLNCLTVNCFPDRPLISVYFTLALPFWSSGRSFVHSCVQSLDLPPNRPAFSSTQPSSINPPAPRALYPQNFCFLDSIFFRLHNYK